MSEGLRGKQGFGLLGIVLGSEAGLTGRGFKFEVQRLSGAKACGLGIRGSKV